MSFRLLVVLVFLLSAAASLIQLASSTTAAIAIYNSLSPMADRAAMAQQAKPHFVLVPLFAQGHFIPMVDMARLIAERGSLVSFVVTPVNAARIKPVINRVKSAGLPIRFVELEFPSGEATGIPDGCESIDLVPSWDFHKAFFVALSYLQVPLELYLRDADPVPTCIVSDNCNWWTAEVARRLNIPRVVFHGPSCFFLLCAENIRAHDAYANVADEFEPVVVPCLPQRIEITQAQAPGWFSWPGWEDIHSRISEAEATADGVVVNTFAELEPEFIQLYRNTTGKRVWPIGPLSLYNKDMANKASRGNKASIDESHVLHWLDSMDPESVVFVCFGSLVVHRPSQVIEIGCGLEASSRPFVWVMKGAEKGPEVEKWMSEGFEERTRERGLVITGWAPQVVILSHPSVGGFVTHCGWNSTLEAVSAGVPLITWPSFADQFLNERLVVDVLGIGVSIGVKVPIYGVKEDEVAATREDVERAVVELMDGGEEGEESRRRARELGEKAREAMEVGGSSHENLSLFIEFVTSRTDCLPSKGREM